MLVLSRRLNEEIVLPGLNVTIRVLGVRGGRVKLGIAAPDKIRLERGELRPPAVESVTGCSFLSPDAACGER